MRVLITGASGGIGAACVQRFLDEGHEVVGFDLLPTAVEHERYRHLIVDVREPNSFPGDLEPQVIVNVAGVQDSADDIAANLRGTINVTERYAFVGEGLAAKPAPAIQSVVNVGSASGHTGSEFPAYAASKGGVIAYTKNLANRLAPQAIANSVDPGGVITPLNRCVMARPITPKQRWATAQEIAEWIYFVGVTNRFMTGQSLLIDGGEAGRTQFIWPE